MDDLGELAINESKTILLTKLKWSLLIKHFLIVNKSKSCKSQCPSHRDYLKTIKPHLSASANDGGV